MKYESDDVKVTFKPNGAAMISIPKLLVKNFMNKEEKYKTKLIVKDGILQIKPIKL